MRRFIQQFSSFISIYLTSIAFSSSPQWDADLAKLTRGASGGIPRSQAQQTGVDTVWSKSTSTRFHEEVSQVVKTEMPDEFDDEFKTEMHAKSLYDNMRNRLELLLQPHRRKGPVLRIFPQSLPIFPREIVESVML
jgi:hypothetical protein